MRIIKTADAFAKINLTLDITGRDERGYHTLNSFMQTISLKDRVTAEVFSEDAFSVSFKTVPEEVCGCERDKNLCFKAAEKFCEVFGIKKGGINIVLEKNIPIAAGLGGGSSDCAATLRLLAKIFSVTDFAKLYEIAASLGSDVPFFLNGGLQKVSGTGDIITPVSGEISDIFVLVKPSAGLSAKEVYEKFDTLPFEKTDFTAKAEASDFSSEFFENGLENAAVLLCGDCKDISEKLRNLGAKNVLLCGSGTTVAGVFKSEGAAEKAVSNFGKEYFTAVCRPVYPIYTD